MFVCLCLFIPRTCVLFIESSTSIRHSHRCHIVTICITLLITELHIVTAIHIIMRYRTALVSVIALTRFLIYTISSALLQPLSPVSPVDELQWLRYFWRPGLLGLDRPVQPWTSITPAGPSSVSIPTDPIRYAGATRTTNGSDTHSFHSDDWVSNPQYRLWEGDHWWSLHPKWYGAYRHFLPKREKLVSMTTHTPSKGCGVYFIQHSPAVTTALPIPCAALRYCHRIHPPLISGVFPPTGRPVILLKDISGHVSLMVSGRGRLIPSLLLSSPGFGVLLFEFFNPCRRRHALIEGLLHTYHVSR